MYKDKHKEAAQRSAQSIMLHIAQRMCSNKGYNTQELAAIIEAEIEEVFSDIEP